MASSPQTILASAGDDPRDMTQQYNTKLPPDEEAQFQQWAQQTGRSNDLYDYDLRGAWKSNANEAANGHLPDTWKKPNHPTFSSESKYSSPTMPGGKWGKEGKGWTFMPSATNLRNLGPDGLAKYFREREPDVKLVLPPEAKVFPSEYNQGEVR